MDEEEDFEEGLAGAAERDEPIEDLDDIQVRNTLVVKILGSWFEEVLSLVINLTILSSKSADVTIHAFYCIQHLKLQSTDGRLGSFHDDGAQHEHERCRGDTRGGRRRGVGGGTIYRVISTT